MNRLIYTFWENVQKESTAYAHRQPPASYYFCDNQKDADACAELVRQGIKQATTHARLWFEIHQEQLPAVGDLAIITDWNEAPVALIGFEYR